MISKEKFNLIFENLGSLGVDTYRSLPKGVKKINTKVIKEVDSDHPSQGQEGETQILYDIGEDQFLLVTVNTDSYGDNEHISSLRLVKPVKKQVTVYTYE